MPSKLDCPELDLRHTGSVDAQLSPPYPAEQTSIDLLEIYDRELESLQGEGAKYEKGLDHEMLVTHLELSEKKPLLRVLFVNGRFMRVAGKPKADTIYSAIGPATVRYLIERIGVSPAFMAVLTYKTWILKTGSCYRIKRARSGTGAGQSTTIEGWYRYSCGLKGLPSHVWFSYTADSATYLVSNCEHNGVQSAILRCVNEGMGSSLLRPMAIDGFVVEAASEEWGQEVLRPRKVLVEYEHIDRATVNKETSQAIRELHVVSYNLLIIKEDMVDHIERLKYLLDVRKTLTEAFGDQIEEGVDVSHSLSFLLSETQIRRRWVQSYADRIGIQINLFYNLSAQRDNKTNLRIADFTSKIATETQKDSSSMITMAAVTMLFLPGTFVSAIFSMVFFEPAPAQGTSIIGLNLVKGWWIFPCITIPLTMLVFVTWNAWRVRRNEMQAKELQSINSDLSSQMLTQPQSGGLAQQPLMQPRTHLNGGQCEKTSVPALVDRFPPNSPAVMMPPHRNVHPASCTCSVTSETFPPLWASSRHSYPSRSRRSSPSWTRTRRRSRSRSRSRTPSPQLDTPVLSFQEGYGSYGPSRNRLADRTEENRAYLVIQPPVLVSELFPEDVEDSPRPRGMGLAEHNRYIRNPPALSRHSNRQLSDVTTSRLHEEDPGLSTHAGPSEVTGLPKPKPRPYIRRVLGQAGAGR